MINDYLYFNFYFSELNFCYLRVLIILIDSLPIVNNKCNMDNSVERIDTEANLVDQPADKNAINISQGSSDDGNGRIPGSLIKESPVQTVQSH